MGFKAEPPHRVDHGNNKCIVLISFNLDVRTGDITHVRVCLSSLMYRASFANFLSG